MVLSKPAEFQLVDQVEGSSNNPDYTTWSHNDLVARVLELEKSISAFASQHQQTKVDAYSSPKSTSKSTPPKPKKSFNHSQHTTRLIALKLAYLGSPYQGFEYHIGTQLTLLPTVEEKLFEALLKSRLVKPKTQYRRNPETGENEVDDSIEFTLGGKGRAGGDTIEGGVGKWVNVEGWGYTKCGRTDRGVSAFGQVVGLRVRSVRKHPRPTSPTTSPDGDEPLPSLPTTVEEDTFDEMDELPYVSILNKLLPPTIRILAYCPTPPPSFSARFNCRSRTYHYFFTNPPIPPRPGVTTTILDIEAMQKAAELYIGLHDFRNLCKVDASKQITNFMRRVVSSSIVKCPMHNTTFDINGGAEKGKRQQELYYFRLKGSAFLWHQVRCMIAVLFLVGQKLESPEIITKLLDVDSNSRKPIYEMADDRPLVLWDCEFDEDEVKWVYPDMVDATPGSREDVIGGVWEQWHESSLDATLAGGLLSLVYNQQGDKIGREKEEMEKDKRRRKIGGPVIVNGTGTPKSLGQYIPLMKRERSETVEVVNRKFAERKGQEWNLRWGAEHRQAWAQKNGAVALADAAVEDGQ